MKISASFICLGAFEMFFSPNFKLWNGYGINSKQGEEKIQRRGV